MIVLVVVNVINLSTKRHVITRSLYIGITSVRQKLDMQWIYEEVLGYLAQPPLLPMSKINSMKKTFEIIQFDINIM